MHYLFNNTFKFPRELERPEYIAFAKTLISIAFTGVLSIVFIRKAF